MASKHLILFDVQAKPGQDFRFLHRIGRYIVDKKPDTVICIGDFSDMPSLSSYDLGKKSYEGRRYKADIAATHEAMDVLLGPLREYNAERRARKKGPWKPRMVMTLGNHEDRITRAVESDPKLDGTIGLDDLRYEEYGWEVHPFLQPVVIDGIVYCHYMVSGPMVRPITTAAALLTKKHQSCIVGHQQGRQVAYSTRADGKMMTAIICGASYPHDEEYLTVQGNNYWRGIAVLHEVEDGQFDEMFVSLKYLERRYGN